MSEIVQHNRDCEFGRKHRFAGIRDYHDFAHQVPIADYESYRPAIAHLLDGKTQILTREAILRFEQTGGSTGGGKWIPCTAALYDAFQRGILPWLGNLLRQRPGAFSGRLFFVISPLTRQQTHTPTGIPLGAGNDLDYFPAPIRQYLTEKILFFPELLAAQSATDWQWHCARRLLATENLSFISLWSPTLLLAILHTLHEAQDSLLASLQNYERRKILAQTLNKPTPDYHRIWPQLDTISCWDSHTAHAPAQTLRTLFPHVHLQGKGLLATEGITTIPYREHSYPLLALNSHFYEFASSDGEIYRAHELQQDQEYRLILTTQGGLYRYDTGDRLRVGGFEENTPRLAFIGREHLISDLCGEKLSEAFVHNAMISVDPQLAHSALLQGVSGEKPHYRLIVNATDSRTLDDSLLSALDHALQKNPQYHYARRIGQLHSLRALKVTNITHYAEQWHGAQQRLSTRKIPLLLPVDGLS